jgi:hypothetical protein
MRMPLHGKIVAIESVTSADRAAMFALMDRHYENVCRRMFENDLDEKDWVIQIHDWTTGELAGFSTQKLLHADIGGRRVAALFSGDTVVAREHWGDRALAQCWGQHALDLIDADPSRELYWLLISKGYKTYRFLPLFFHEFNPHPDCDWREEDRATRDALIGLKFASSFDADRGVVTAGPNHDRLRPGVADLTAERLGDRFVRFFAQCNPGHARGDELVCLAPLTRENFTSAAYRVIGPRPAAAGVA